jgi:adenylylsulfate kinase
VSAGGAAGVVVWLCGLPSSGKSTLARAAAARLREAGRAALVLDGDEVRGALVPAPGYDERARDAFYDTLARLAALAAAQGLVVLVPATANRRAFRARARAMAPSFVEVWVDTPVEECRRRDAKGLYAAETAGLPGAGAPFEAPEAAELVVRPGEADAVERVVRAAVDAARAR